jgi:membrane-associated phospholipid phosphatase
MISNVNDDRANAALTMELGGIMNEHGDENRISSSSLLREGSHEEENHVESSSPRNTTLRAYLSSPLFVELLCCLIPLILGIVLELANITPRIRLIPFQLLESSGEYVVNQIYNEILDGETISSTVLLLMACIIPSVIQFLLSYAEGKLHKSACVWFSGVGLTIFSTNGIKLYVGYLRPIFYDVCEPDDNYEQCGSESDREVRLSFPSGHASLSVCGLLILSLYLERRFGVSKLREVARHQTNGQIKVGPLRVLSIICYSPMLLALFIASSRVADNKHFPADVVGGAVLGGSIANMVHGIWYDRKIDILKCRRF